MKISTKFLSSCLSLGTVFTLLLSSQSAKAADFPVSDSAGFQAALDQAAMNDQDDTINLAAGTYATADNGGNPFTYTAAAAEAFNLTIQGIGGDVTILDGGSADQVMFIDTDIGMLDDTDVTISLLNFAAVNGYDSDDGAGLEINITNATVMLDGLLFQGNIADDDGGGVKILGNGDITIENSIFDSNTSSGGSFGGGGGLLIRRLGSPHGDVLLGNNDFYNNSDNSGAGEGGAVYLDFDDPNSTADVYNNIFYLNTTAGPIDSDIFFQNDDDDPEGPTLNIINNIAWAVELECPTCGTITQTDTLAVDPLFVDADNGDFNLQATSPARDSGDNLVPGLPTLDYLGNARIMGPVVAAIVDRGAIEFIASPPPPAPEDTDDQTDDELDPQVNSLDGTSVGGGGCSLSTSTASASSTLPAAFALLLALAAAWRLHSSKQA